MYSRLASQFLGVGLAFCALACSAGPPPSPQAGMLTANLESGTVNYEFFRPAAAPAPLVIVVHGFSRSGANMRDWGLHLAAEGFAVAVPTLPTWANHPRNAQAVAQLVDHLRSDPATSAAIDPRRVALIGYSSGGLSSFLAAAQRGDVDIWIGLDPVDRYRLAVAAAPKVACRIVALLAEPSDCNKRANWNAVTYADGVDSLTLIVAGAVHTDCESPTDRLAEIACGKSDSQRRRVFIEYASAALRDEFFKDAQSTRALAALGGDGRIRLVGASQTASSPPHAAAAESEAK